MGLRTWLKQRLGLRNQSFALDLVAPAVVSFPPPTRLGLNLTIPEQPWSVARLVGLFHDAKIHPSLESLKAARVARHRLSLFWMTAPVDQLEMLYSGVIGDLQRQQLEGPLVHQELASDEHQWRDQLAQRMVNPQERSRHLNLLLALMPYSKPGGLSVDDALNVLPTWLLKDYVVYCEPSLKHQLEGPAGYLAPALGDSSTLESAEGARESDIKDLPVLCARRGDEAMEWFRDESALNRIKALINLYEMAPSDQETREELSGIRQVIAQLWLDVEPLQLRTLYQTSVGLITRSLITAGFGSDLVDADDQQAKGALVEAVRDVSRPERHGVILATLLYVPLNKVKIDSVEGLPTWLIDELASF
jgi:hypothetical protein